MTDGFEGSFRIIRHYDALIDMGNDPVHDTDVLREYMNKWDGRIFIDEMILDKDKSVLEIGVGTGRLAIRTAPLCGSFTGIDISPKTVNRAQKNLSAFSNTHIICDDFLTHDFGEKRFDVIYSSLTFMHIKNKQCAFNKVSALLSEKGRFVLSIDKNQNKEIDTGTSRITVFPDNPTDTERYLLTAGFDTESKSETEFAFIFTAKLR